MFKQLLALVTILSLTSSAMFMYGLISSSNEHQNRIEKMHEFAGSKYDRDSELKVEFEDPMANIFSQLYSTRGAGISSFALEKQFWSEAGYGEQCESFEYLKMFGSKITAEDYRDSETCCKDPHVSMLLPFVFDKKASRFLVMCDLADDAHVIGIDAFVFAKAMDDKFGDDVDFMSLVTEEFKED